MPKTKSGQVKLVLKPTLHPGKASQAGEFSLVQIQVLVSALIITEDLLAHGQGQLCPKLPEESPQVILTPPRVNQSSPLPTAAHLCPVLICAPQPIVAACPVGTTITLYSVISLL